MIIYIPQGHSARLTRTSLEHGITSLYTDSFSNCIILACIGQDKLVLMHLDYQTIINTQSFGQIRQEIEWVGEPKSIFIIHRDSPACEVLCDQFSKLWPSERDNLKIVRMDGEHDGVELSFANDADSAWHPQIKKHPISISPKGLVHHPEEKAILTVQKIEEIMSTLAMSLAGVSLRIKKLSIFDAFSWESIPSDNLVVDTSHPLVKEQMGRIKSTMPAVDIAGIIAGIIMHLQSKNVTIVEDLAELAFSTAYYFQAYSCDYDETRAFIINIKDLIKMRGPDAKIPEERKFILTLEKTVEIEPFSFTNINAIFEHFKASSASESQFKKDMLSELTTFTRYYSEFQTYRQYEVANRAQLEQASKALPSILDMLCASKFYEAYDLSLRVLALCLPVVTKVNEPLMLTFEYLGKSYLGLGDHQRAKDFLTLAHACANQRAIDFQKKNRNTPFFTSDYRNYLNKVRQLNDDIKTCEPRNALNSAV